MERYKSGDIVLTQGTGLISKLIRKFTRDKYESITKVNHVGIVVEGGDDKDVVIVEALTGVKKHTMWSQYALTGDKVAIYRSLDLSEKERNAIVNKAEMYVGRQYGYFKIVAHLFDWALGGRYVFRRIAAMDNYPICSWVVAQSYATVGKNFGVEAGAASPDDIWDHIQKNKSKYKCVRALREVF
jgi:hypothetical protein